MRTERIERMREKYFNSKPCITAERIELATEAFKKYAGDPMPVFRAEVTAHVMRNMTPLIIEDELIVGTETNQYRGANLFPEVCSTEWIIDEIEDFETRSTDPYDISDEDKEKIRSLKEYWEGKAIEDIADEILPEHVKTARDLDVISIGETNAVSGETTCDHDTLLQLGLKGYKKICQEKIEEVRGGNQEKQKKVDFWRACIVVCDGLIDYAHKMADELDRKAALCNDEDRKNELLTMAKNCRVVPENPPESFWQALQMVWFIHVAFHIEADTTACGFARFDQYMFPYYSKDIEDGVLTRERALELLESFYLKCCEVYEVRDKWYAQSFAGYPMWETLMVGGVKPDGTDGTNDLSFLCLEAADDMRTTQPVMALRVWDETPDELIRFGAKMVQEGQANPGFFNDNAAIKMTLGKGCTIEEARNWAIVGCIQPGPGGGATDGSPDAGYVNGPKVLSLVLHNGVDPETGQQVGLKTGDPRDFKNINELIDAVKKQLIYFYGLIKEGFDLMQSYHSESIPVIFASMATKGCVESGMSVQEGGAKYTTAAMYITGPANLADSLVAIETCVFDEKDITMDELITALDANYDGYERIRQLLINKPPKFGNDNEHVDGLYADILGFIAENVQTWPDGRKGGHYSFCNLSQTVNITHGEVCQATPDGRFAGETLNDNASPSMGMDINGPTATIKSVASMKQERFHDGALFNLRFDPKGVEGEKGLQTIEGIIRTYFDNGGEHIQINVVDDKTLRDAQIHPEKHRGLMVRVAGYMAYFTELDKAAQDSIIDRTAHLKEA